ncbi:MAG: hypothetical protein ACPGJE_04655 [Wenzhouxiangellaceae bacterium]
MNAVPPVASVADSSAAPASAATAEKTKLSASDWEQAAMDLIAEKGVAALAIEPLARRLGMLNPGAPHLVTP